MISSSTHRKIETYIFFSIDFQKKIYSELRISMKMQLSFLIQIQLKNQLYRIFENVYIEEFHSTIFLNERTSKIFFSDSIWKIFCTMLFYLRIYCKEFLHDLFLFTSRTHSQSISLFESEFLSIHLQ